MNGDASILHADLDSFYASVEQRDDPSLRGRPVLVGSGVVLAASYEAKARGVRTPMPGRMARQLCPDAVVCLPRFDAYSAASRQVFAIFEATTPLVDPVSIDEAFLEVGGLRRISGVPEQIAHRLRQQVAAEVGLPITVGVARTKFLAKVASRAAKPDGLLVVAPDRELEFLHPLRVEMLWGVGAITARRLHARGIRTVGDLAAQTPQSLSSYLGPAAGRQLHALSSNHDPRRVQAGRRRGSIGSQRAIGWGPKTFADIEATLAGLVDRVTGRMRSAGRRGRTVVLRIRFEDFDRITRSHTLPVPTAQTALVLDIARGLLRGVRPLIDQRGLSLVGVSVAQLTGEDVAQLELPFTDPDLGALDHAVDLVHDRYGRSALTRGALVGRGSGLEVPLLPD